MRLGIDAGPEDLVDAGFCVAAGNASSSVDCQDVGSDLGHFGFGKLEFLAVALDHDPVVLGDTVDLGLYGSVDVLDSLAGWTGELSAGRFPIAQFRGDLAGLAGALGLVVLGLLEDIQN